MPKRSIRAVLSVAVLAGGTAVALQFATGAADADAMVKSLPITGFGDIAVDGKSKRIFLSDPTGGKLVTLDYDGKVLATADKLPGLGDLLLSDDGSRLYAAWSTGQAILAFDPATSARLDTYSTSGIKPSSLAQAGGKIWFGEEDGIGSLDLSSNEPIVAPGSMTGGLNWHSAPDLAATPTRPGVVAAVGSADGRVAYRLLDITKNPPAVLAERNAGRGTDMKFSPDGERLLVTDNSGGSSALSADDLSTIETYRAAQGGGGAIAARADGTIAVASTGYKDDAVSLFEPGTTSPLRSLDLLDPGLPYNALSDPGLMEAGIAWEPGGRRIFGVSWTSSTNASNPGPWYSLQVLNSLKTPTVQFTAPAEAVLSQAYTVSIAFGTPVPAGLPLEITRTDPATPGGKRVGPETVPATGVVTLPDKQATPGKVTYTVKVTGNETFASTTATRTVSVNPPKKATTLTLDRNGSTFAYGTTATFTAKLGATGTSRTVEIWADPAGADQPNRLVRKANVNAKGVMTASFRLTRNTAMTAVFRGDARTTAKSVKSSVSARASVATVVTGHYKSAKIGSLPTYHFRKTKHPVFTTTMSMYPKRRAAMQIDVLIRGKWTLWGPGNYPLDSAGKVKYTLRGTHSVGVRYRVRFAYLYAKSGDTANTTTYGPYRYFTFTN